VVAFVLRGENITFKYFTAQAHSLWWIAETAPGPLFGPQPWSLCRISLRAITGYPTTPANKSTPLVIIYLFGKNPNSFGFGFSNNSPE
jgi:hypothetical protein